MDRVPTTGDHPTHVPAQAGACAFVSAETAATVHRIGGDLLDRLEQAGRQELAALLAAADAPDATASAAPLDPVESVIAWDLAAGF